ncbi:MAG: class E sortase [Beutenbergiaceae bacterium]
MSQDETLTRTQLRGDRKRRRRPSALMMAIGVLGELLITMGIVVALFVVWQVFWTDVEGSRAANSNIASFEEELPQSPEIPGTEQYGEPPVEVLPPEGQTFATMLVPRWGEDWEFPIAEGVDRDQVLDAGYVGHYPQTQGPGELGNFAIAGHRQSHARPFYGVADLEVGDPLIVQTEQAWYVYRVSDSYIVDPTQVEVLAANPQDPGASASARTITLTTCHPLWSTRERWIIHGELDYWVDRAEGRPAILIDQEDN